MVKSEVHDIDLKKAQDFLAHNKPFDHETAGTNRPISLTTINNYAVQMLKGHWKLIHAGLGFDTKGFLIDGQQRMMALIQAATEGAIDGDTVLPPKPRIKIKFNVTWGLDPSVFAVVDKGRGRSNDQILAMAGYHDQFNLASTARTIYLYQTYPPTIWSRVKITGDEILEIVQKLGVNEGDYLTVGRRFKTVGGIPSMMSAGYYLCKLAYPSGPHEDFLEAVISGVNLKQDDPRMALRNYLINSGLSKSRTKRQRRNSLPQLAVYIKAWNDYVNGKKRQLLAFREDEKLPTPIEVVDD